MGFEVGQLVEVRSTPLGHHFGAGAQKKANTAAVFLEADEPSSDPQTFPANARESYFLILQKTSAVEGPARASLMTDSQTNHLWQIGFLIHLAGIIFCFWFF